MLAFNRINLFLKTNAIKRSNHYGQGSRTGTYGTNSQAVKANAPLS